MTDTPDAYLIGNAITRECPDCHAKPGAACVNELFEFEMHMPHIKRQKPETTHE